MSYKGNYFLRAVAFFENLNCINVEVTKIALRFSFVCHTSSICGNLQVNNTHKYKNLPQISFKIRYWHMTCHFYVLVCESTNTPFCHIPILISGNQRHNTISYNISKQNKKVIKVFNVVLERFTLVNM